MLQSAFDMTFYTMLNVFYAVNTSFGFIIHADNDAFHIKVFLVIFWLLYRKCGLKDTSYITQTVCLLLYVQEVLSLDTILSITISVRGV